MLHQIGAGTLGPVFRAYDAERERLVAIKLFTADLAPDKVHRFVNALEALVSARLAHPALSAPLATGIRDVSAYLVQDYVAADSLDQAVREFGPAPPADALRVAAQLAGALDFAAAVNINHGALHPRDVLLSTDDTRLTGIGIARALETIGVAAPVRRPYTAPERIAGSAWDRRADVFSLAALIYELLWGRRIPGAGSHAADGLTPIDGADLNAVQSVFRRALAENPNDRFSNALEFADALKSAFADVPAAEPVIAAAAAVPVRNADKEPRLPLDEFATEPAIDTLDLRQAEEARYEDVETAPAVPVVEVPMRSDADSAAPFPGPPPISVIERSRSAVWPLMAALVIGLAIGFAGGYGVNSRDRSAAAAPATPDGREATDVAVSEPPKPPAPAPVAASEPPPEVRLKADTTTATPDGGRSVRLQPDRQSGVQTDRMSAPPVTRPPAPSKTPALTRANRTPPQRPSRPAERASAAPAPPAPASGTAGRFVGSLNVETKPEGARVFLDGRLIGTTPLLVPGISAGEHAIRIERDGYRRWSSSIRIVASERNRVTASLER